MKDLKIVTVDGESRIATMETTDSVKLVYGIEKLMQEVIKTSIGDVDPKRITASVGGNLTKLLGPESSSSRSVAELSPLLVSYIMDVESYIKLTQSQEDLSLEESLLSITVVDIYREDVSRALRVDLLVKNKLNQIITSSLGAQNV